jgi:hypothetical protein
MRTTPLSYPLPRNQNGNYALLDCKSLETILNDQNLKNLIPRTFLAVNEPIARFLDVKEGYDRAGALSGLANLLFYDQTFVNRPALTRTGLLAKLEESSLKEVVSPVEFEKDDYQKVDETLKTFCASADGKDKNALSSFEDDFDSYLKDDVDQLAAEQISILERVVSSDGPVLLRALFYFELSRLKSLPVILHRSKRDFAVRFQTYMNRLASAEIERIVEEGQRDMFKGDAFSVEVPSLQLLILNKAQQDGVSPIEAALRIHRTQSCKDFRALVRKLQVAILNRERAEIARITNAVKKNIDPWVESLDRLEGLRHVTRNISFDTVSFGTSPRVGLKIDPGPAITIRDRVLGWINKPPMYLFFLNDWFYGTPKV